MDYQLGFPWPTVGDAGAGCRPGVQDIRSIGQPDAGYDLAGSWRSAYPTPGANNAAVMADNIRRISAKSIICPNSPKAGCCDDYGQSDDLDGVATVTLRYQFVDPGGYIR